MEVEQDDDILALRARYLANQAGYTEIDQLKKWIDYSKSNRQYFEQVRNIWNASDQQIDSESINTQEALGKVLGKINKVSSVKILWQYWKKIAAFMILPLVISSLLLIHPGPRRKAFSEEPVYNEVYAAFGTRSSLKLADGTLVWLNSGSSLRYPDKFNKESRQVYLKGEAYFEVESDYSKPFIVKTSSLEVKATGTKFGVLDYDLQPITEVTLVSGKVFVTESDIKSPQLSTELNPNQHLHYNRKTGIKSITNEDTYRFVSWKDGMLIFRNESLGEVTKKIGQIFNVDIEIQDSSLIDYHYRATFQDESLEEILKLLKYSSPIDFIELSRKPLADGSFPRRKVIIFAAK